MSLSHHLKDIGDNNLDNEGKKLANSGNYNGLVDGIPKKIRDSLKTYFNNEGEKTSLFKL